MEIYVNQRIVIHLIFILIIVMHAEVSSVQEHTYEACYGITHDDFLNLQCGTNEILYVYDVYTYAKQLSTFGSYGCVHTRLSPTYNTTECCVYVSDTEDCGMRYYGSSFIHYCVGVNTCLNQVAWNNTLNVCNQAVYFSETHYMKAFYNCIPNSDILDICSSGSTLGNPVYIWSLNYPGKQGDCSTTSGCACRASTSGSVMKVNVLDLRLHDYSTGDCHQQLHITDGDTESVISCTSYHAFKRTTAYTSSSSQIQIRFDNVFAYATGNFWIEIESINDIDNVSLSCGSVTAVYGCGATLDTVTTSLTTETTTTSTTITTTIETTTNTETTNLETTYTDSTSAETTNTATTTTAQETTTTVTTVTDTETTNTAPTASESTDTTVTTTSAKTKEGQTTSTNGLSQAALIGIICGCVVLAVFLWRTIFQAIFMVVLKYCRIHYYKKGMRQNAARKPKPVVSKSTKQVNTKRIHVSERPDADNNIQTKKKTKMSSKSTVDPERIPSVGRNVKVHDITGKSLDVQVVSVIGNNVKVKEDGKVRWINLSRVN